MRLASLLAGAGSLALLAPSVLAGVSTPGSVLVFPLQRTGLREFTIVSVTNTSTDPQGGSTRVHYQYANATPNPNDPFRPLNCLVANRGELLTPADTLSVSTTCHNFPGSEGFLVVTAQSPTGGNWSHDHLVGSELVLTGAGGVFALEAIALRAMTPPGSPTELNGNGAADFDGVEYEPLPDLLYLDSFLAAADWNLVLLNLTGGPKDMNDVRFTVWNDNEFPLSTQVAFNCWFEQPLRRISAVFTDAFLRGATPHDPDELDLYCNDAVQLETGWARIDSAGVRTPGGTLVASDGALLGALTSGSGARFDAGQLLRGSHATQLNGSAFAP